MRFTKGELNVMRLLWEHGEMNPPEIAKLCEPPLKDAALRAMLAVLVDKGHVERRREGRAYFYQAITPQRGAFHTMLRELVDTFCEGSAKKLMFNLVEEEKLSNEEIKQLQTLAKSAKSSKRGKK